MERRQQMIMLARSVAKATILSGFCFVTNVIQVGMDHVYDQHYLSFQKGTGFVHHVSM
jgi:hypothetical protein